MFILTTSAAVGPFSFLAVAGPMLLLLPLPLLVLIGWASGSYLHLSLPVASLGCLIATAVIISKIVDDQELGWYEGVALVTLYLVLMIGSLLIF